MANYEMLNGTIVPMQCYSPNETTGVVISLTVTCTEPLAVVTVDGAQQCNGMPITSV